MRDIKKLILFSIIVILINSIININIFSLSGNDDYNNVDKIKPGKEKKGTLYYTRYRKVKGREIEFNDRDEIKKDEAEILPKYYKVEYDAKGKIKKAYKFEQNRLEPFIEVTWKGDKIETQTFYVDGLKSQKHYFNANGNLAKVEFYQKGELFGIRYYRNGIKVKEQFISNGKVIDERLY